MIPAINAAAACGFGLGWWSACHRLRRRIGDLHLECAGYTRENEMLRAGVAEIRRTLR